MKGIQEFNNVVQGLADTSEEENAKEENEEDDDDDDDDKEGEDEGKDEFDESLEPTSAKRSFNYNVIMLYKSYYYQE
jgi:hypothetical protein